MLNVLWYIFKFTINFNLYEWLFYKQNLLSLQRWWWTNYNILSLWYRLIPEYMYNRKCRDSYANTNRWPFFARTCVREFYVTIWVRFNIIIGNELRFNNLEACGFCYFSTYFLFVIYYLFCFKFVLLILGSAFSFHPIHNPWVILFKLVVLTTTYL